MHKKISIEIQETMCQHIFYKKGLRFIDISFLFQSVKQNIFPNGKFKLMSAILIYDKHN